MEKVAIVNSCGATYSFKQLEDSIDTAIELLKAVKPEMICICNKDEFDTVTAVYAALRTNTSFYVLPGTVSEMELNVKFGMYDPGLIVSDYITDQFYLSLSLKSMKINIGKEGSRLIDPDIMDSITNAVDLASRGLELDVTHIGSENPQAICFHKGINENGYKDSVFSHEQLHRGIMNASRLYKPSDHVIYMESLDLIYDLINGVFAPLHTGATVKFVLDNRVPFSSNRRTVKAYVSSQTINNVSDILRRQMPKFHKAIPFIGRFWLKHQFMNFIGTVTDFDLIIPGRIGNIKLINLLGRSVTTLYTLCEIASFVSSKKHSRIKEDYSVGKPIPTTRIDVRKSNRWHGVAYIESNELCTTTCREEIKELDTGDVVSHNRKGEIVILSKLNLITEDFYGKPIKTALYLDYVLKQDEVRNAQFLAYHSRLILAVEPNVEYLTSKDMSLNDFIEYCKILEKKMNDKLRFEAGCFSMVLISPYLLKEGLNMDTYKIFARG